MNLDLGKLERLISQRTDVIEQIVAETGYKAKTVIGVGTYLLDNEGDIDLLTANQLVTYERFIKPLL